MSPWLARLAAYLLTSARKKGLDSGLLNPSSIGWIDLEVRLLTSSPASENRGDKPEQDDAIGLRDVGRKAEIVDP